MSAHTPGPWSIQQIHDAKNGYADWQTYAIRGPENVCLAMVGDVDHYKSERIPHNARLIAAAPAMLELLKLAQVRLFMLDGANAEYEAIDTLLTELGITNRRPA